MRGKPVEQELLRDLPLLGGRVRTEHADRPSAISALLDEPGAVGKMVWLLQADSDLDVRPPDTERLANGSDRAFGDR